MTTVRFDARLTTRPDFPRVSGALIERARKLSAATLHEAAGRIGALPSAIKPLNPAMRLCGPALPVQSPGGDNLWLHRALYVAKPGDILVVHVSGAHEHGYWGEVMATAAQARHLGGLVIDGCVRDGHLLLEMDFPVFARGLCIRGTGKDFAASGTIGLPVAFGDVEVHAGDLIFGDHDGVVCLPAESTEGFIEASVARETHETQAMQRLRAGDSTLRIFGWE